MSVKDSPKSSSYDIFPEERETICTALEMLIASNRRAERSAKSPTVAAAYRQMADSVEALYAKFR